MTNTISIKELLAIFEQSNINLAFVVNRNGKLEVSHNQLELLCDLFQNTPEFDHEAVFIGRDPRFKTLFFAFVHNTTRGLSQGGLRVTSYLNDTVEAVIKDGLRLSQGMTRKNAICEIWWGGGKGIIPITKELVEENFCGDKTLYKPSDDEDNDLYRCRMRDELFEAYGEFVASLGGVYYTAEDIGSTKGDMKAILSKNRFVTCIPKKLGGSGDPGKHTAKGVFLAIKTAWRHLHPKSNGNLENVRVAVQGAGHVGEALIKNLVDAEAQVWVSDVTWEGDRGEENLAKFKKNLQEPCVRL